MQWPEFYLTYFVQNLQSTRTTTKFQTYFQHIESFTIAVIPSTYQ